MISPGQIRSLFLDMNVPLIISDKTGLIVNVNHRAEKLLGIREDDLIKRHINALMTPKEREISTRSISRDPKTGMMMWLLQDTQENKESESRGSEPFLAAMTHEIRTPMNGIIGMTDLALEEEMSPVLKEYLDVIHISADSLMRVINDILDYSKIETGNLLLEEIPVTLPDFLDSIVKLFSAQARSKGLEFRYSGEENLPETIIGDPVRIRQIIQNLLNNALKFTSSGYIELSSYLNSDQSRIYFSISDTGIGIPAEKQHLLFQSFTQIDASTTRKYGGTGLGLAICAYLTSKMNGQIEVKSSEGKGSTFRFFLPLVLPEEEKNESAGSADCNDISIDHSISEAPLVLLLEDNRVNQFLAVKTMEKAGYRVVTAENGYEGIERYKENRPDIILMDIQMPGKDGYETAREIRLLEEESKESTPIIALTALALSSDRDKITEAGMNDFLGKPVSPIDLKQMLLKYCRQ